MTWHFSSLGDCISPGDVFPFKKNHHNSNLWDVWSALFTSKQEEFSLNCYLIKIKRSYHWSYLRFILQPSLVFILATSPFPWGRICDSWGYNRWPMLHIMLSPWKKCLMSSGWWSLMLVTIQMLKGSSGWREACGMPKKALPLQWVREDSQLSVLFLVMNTGNSSLMDTLLSSLYRLQEPKKTQNNECSGC